MENSFQFLIYRSAEEDVSVNAIVKDESVWLTQKGMAELFGCSVDNISLHLKNIFASGELDKDSVTEKISATAADGKNYRTQFYNLDAIISVGYRVNSRRATRFRIWATGVLKEYMTKGFVLDDERLKQGRDAFGTDYFRELLPERAAVIDGNEGTVRHLGVVLESLGKLAPEDATGGVELANSDPSERIAELSRKLLNV